MIEILSSQVANLIAAGEVVERPASALKELLENAVDAGATAVTAEIKRGGVSFIRVTDNGGGMSSEDAVRAFMRHATSKLRTAEDLQAIATMGFRGEALAAIAAVSRVELLTRLRGETAGTSVSLEAGTVTGHGQAGCPEGTTIVVRDLFYNTPARQKFLKKDSTEAAAAQEAVVRTALARPGLSVRLIKDGAQVLHTPGGGQLKNCLYSIFGGDLVKSLCPVPGGGGAVQLQGFTGLPSYARSSRSMQYFFVCGRPVRSRILTAALEDAYAGALPGGRFPVCCLHIDMPLETFDINVHPAKSEIKFQSDRTVFDAVYHACREALRQAGAETAPLVKIAPYMPRTEISAYQTRSEPGSSVSQSSFAPPQPAGDPIQPAPLAHRLIGEALGGYLLVETPEALWVIDKHAAHERLLFNRLKAGEKPFLSQQLLTPRAVTLSQPEADVLTQELPFMREAGFELEPMGPGTLAVRAAPGDIDESELPALLSKMAALLLTGRRPELREEAMRMVACKAAVKLGRSSRREDMERLAALVMETPDLRHCPHGRPVAMRLTKGDLGRQFGR
jgi:DNA mismatch repair protein MutL